MKVAIINAVIRGSTGKIMIQTAEVARNNNIDCFTFSSKRGSGGEKIKHHLYLDNKIEYTIGQVGGYFTGMENVFSRFATLRLIRKLEQIKPDIIHLHVIHGYYLDYILLFKYIKKQNVRVIWTLHDCWSFTGRCPYFQLTGCNKWKTGCYDCIYDRKQYPASLWFDRSRKNWQAKKVAFTGVKNMTIVTPSKWLAGLVKQSFLGEYPVKVINNGIDLSVFKPTDINFRTKYNIEDKFILLGVANYWNERKGLDVFIELSKRLDDKFKIVLVGTNENVDKQLPDNIISIHRTHNQTELAEIYTAADLFVNPTREDNYPTVNMEAIACGTPVVTFNTGGSGEIPDENSGVVLSENTLEALYAKIIEISENNCFSELECLKHASNFAANIKYKEYIELYV